MNFLIPFCIKLKKDIKGFKKNVVYTVLAVDSIMYVSKKEEVINKDVKVNSAWDDDDEEVKSSSQIREEEKQVLWFLIASEKSGKFIWIDSQDTNFVGIMNSTKLSIADYIKIGEDLRPKKELK